MSASLDEVLLRAGDGTELEADIYHPDRPPRGGVVVVHGFSATRRLAAVVEQAEALADHGFLVLAGIVLVSMATSWHWVLTFRGLAAAFLTRTQVGRTYTRRRTGIRVASQWEPGEPPTALVRRVRVPVAIVHGQRDRMLRPSAAQDLFAAAPEPRRLDLVAGMGHSFQPAAVPVVTRAVEWAFDQGRVNRHART